MVDPAVIVGWREGRSFDTQAGAKLGFAAHPKSQYRYSVLDDVEAAHDVRGARDGSRPAASLAADDLVRHAHDVLDSLESTGVMDEPVVLYRMSGANFLIHGALRLSCVAKIRAARPERFQVVPAMFFDGSPAEARREVFVRQHVSRHGVRALTISEQVASVSNMARLGMDRGEVVRRMGWTKSPWYLEAMLALAKSRTQEELLALDDSMRSLGDDDLASDARYREILSDATPRPRSLVPRVTTSPILKGLRRDHSSVKTFLSNAMRCEELREFPEVLSRLQVLASRFSDFSKRAIAAELSRTTAAPDPGRPSSRNDRSPSP